MRNIINHNINKKSWFMKSSMFKLFIFLLSLFFTSCNNGTYEQEHSFLSEAIKKINVSKEYDWIVILPGLGCHGCIQEGEFFMKNNIQNKKILYILTNLSSRKIFQAKTGIKLKEHENVFIDRENIFKLKTDNAIYPCIIQISNGDIMDHTFQSPQRAIFNEINKNINK